MSVPNHTTGLPFTQTCKVFQALAFAAHKHRDQRRKDAGAAPYINHPIALADILVNEGDVTDYVVLCAAILHDTIEDTETTYEELVVAFGKEITDVFERMHNVILMHFDLDEVFDGRTKWFCIKDSPGRAYSRPNAAEVAALQAVVHASQIDGTANAEVLGKLRSTIKIAFDSAGRMRLENDLELLTRLQRSRVTAGPAVIASPEDLTTIQSAILSSHCVEFEYRSGTADEASWRRVIAYGLVHGPITYLVSKLPDREDPPITFRLDRMTKVRVSDLTGSPPEEWDLDNWLAGSFSIWRETGFDIVLRMQPWAVERAKAWAFHPAQIVEECGDQLLIRFHAGGLLELANHLFLWAGGLQIEAPDDLKTMMAERLELAQAMLRPELS